MAKTSNRQTELSDKGRHAQKRGSARQMTLMPVVGAERRNTLKKSGSSGRGRARIRMDEDRPYRGLRGSAAEASGGGAAPGEREGLERTAHGVQRGRWKRAKETQAWLEQRHGIALSLPGTRTG